MLKRIPHTSQEIGGEFETRDYAAAHAKHARSQFSAVLSELRCCVTPAAAGGRMLEIGSGPGFLTSIMADRYPQAELNALELSPDMISIAQSVVAERHHPSRVRFICGSVDDRRLLAGLGKFDLVISTFSLHHWEDPVRSLQTMVRVLKEGGRMMLHDLKRVGWLYLLPFRNGFIASVRAAYRRKEIKEMMQQAGIERYHITTPFPYFWQTIHVVKQPLAQ